MKPLVAGGKARRRLVLALVLSFLFACRLSPRSPVATGVPIQVDPGLTPSAGTVGPLATAYPEHPGLPTSTGGERLIGTYVRPQEIGEWCDELQHYNARFTWMAVPWNAVEPTRGHFNWVQADMIVETAQSCGLDIGFHILSRSSWATLPPPQDQRQKTPSMPPKDMNDYYNFVFSLASHFKGRVSRYSIENEAHATSNWPSPPQTYFELLATAYRAVKAADPNALVEDSGLSSSAIGVLIANDMKQAGSVQEAVQFWNHYYSNYAPARGLGEPIVVNQGDDLATVLGQSEAQRVIEWASQLFASHKNYDIIQLHYFGPWDEIPRVMGWVHDQQRAQGTNKPIEFWEFGYGWDDPSTYDPQAHARDEAKYLTAALGEGALRALSWQFTDFAAQLGHPGLITASGPRPAAETFRTTAEKLNGVTRSERLDLGASVWAYRFEKPDGEVVYVLWSLEPKTVRLPVAGQLVTVTTITGETKSADPLAVEVQDSPIFVESP